MSEWHLERLDTSESGSEDYDLHGGGLTIELARRADGSWEFWNAVLPGGHSVGSRAIIDTKAAVWLEAERKAESS